MKYIRWAARCFCFYAIFVVLCGTSIAVCEKPTTLRVVGVPIGRFENQWGIPTLTDVKVDVRNVGIVDAVEIKVSVQTPAGARLELSGPDTLGPNKTATYTGTTQEFVTTDKKITAIVSCKNCRR